MSIIEEVLATREKMNVSFTIKSDDLDYVVESVATRILEKMLQPQPVATEKKYLYSIKELAEFMQCSIVTAQKMKNSGRIPYSQTGRKVKFDCDAVMAAISYNAKTVRR